MLVQNVCLNVMIYDVDNECRSYPASLIKMVCLHKMIRKQFCRVLSEDKWILHPFVFPGLLLEKFITNSRNAILFDLSRNLFLFSVRLACCKMFF